MIQWDKSTDTTAPNIPHCTLFCKIQKNIPPDKPKPITIISLIGALLRLKAMALPAASLGRIRYSQRDKSVRAGTAATEQNSSGTCFPKSLSFQERASI